MKTILTITLSLVLLMVGIAGGSENGWTESKTICNGPIEACSFDEIYLPIPGMEWEVIMPEDCKDCIEVKQGKVVVRIWPDGTIEKQFFLILEGTPYTTDDWTPLRPDYTWPPNQGMRQ